MDVLTLVLPLNTPASPAPAGTESVLPETGAGPIDFAALLAAGLDIAQAAVNPGAPQSTQAAQSEKNLSEETETPQAQALPAALEALAILPQNVLPPASHPASAGSGDSAPSAPEGQSRDLDFTVADSTQRHAPVAADAAMIAGLPATGSQSSATGSQSSADADAQFVRAEPAQEIALPTVGLDRESPRANVLEPALTTQPGSIAMPLPPAVERQVAPQATALLEVGAPLSGPGFADALSRQVVWMVDKDAQIAELRINPPELGPVEVRLTLSGDEASAQFFSAHAEVRSALESALTRLREAMAQAGIQLGEATVSAESFRDQADARAQAREARHGYRDERSLNESSWSAGAAPAPRIKRGLVDLFA